jgi:hypothetical protein
MKAPGGVPGEGFSLVEEISGEDGSSTAGSSAKEICAAGTGVEIVAGKAEGRLLTQQRWSAGCG